MSHAVAIEISGGSAEGDSDSGTAVSVDAVVDADGSSSEEPPSRSTSTLHPVNTATQISKSASGRAADMLEFYADPSTLRSQMAQADQR